MVKIDIPSSGNLTVCCSKMMVGRRSFPRLAAFQGQTVTPPKTNMEPKNVGVEDDFPFQRGDFQVPC